MAPRSRISYSESGLVQTPRDRKRARDIAEHERVRGDWQARREEHMAMAREAYAAVETAAGLRAWLELRGRINRPDYSWKNIALIAWQAPDARYVQGAGSRRKGTGWFGAGVSVVKGQTAIRITGPGGKPLNVFDVSQTDADADPNYAVPEPVEDSARLEELEHAAAGALEGEPVEVVALTAAILAAREGIAVPDLPACTREHVARAHAAARELEAVV